MADKNNGAIEEPEVIIPEEKVERGSTGRYVDNLMKQATDAGIKINPIKKENDNGDGKVEPPEPPKPDDKKFDYTPFKDINDDDYKKIDSILQENKVTNPAIRYTLANQMNNAKKEQRLATERDVRIKELEKAGIKEVEVDKKYAETVNGLKSDFFGTYEKLRSEHQLPDISSIAKMIASGNTLQAQIAHYQENVLVPELEKKHNIETGTFVFDSGDAWKAGTPSYEYRVKTADKEAELRSKWQDDERRISDAAGEMVKIRNAQLVELKDKYFPVTKKDDGSDEYKQEVESQDKKYQDMLGVLDSVYDDMKAGKAIPVERNPFVFKNVFRGVFYDELSKIDITNAIKKVHEQYAKHRLFLPASEMPEDMTKIKGEPPDGKSGTFKVGDTRISPQSRFLSRVNKELTK